MKAKKVPNNKAPAQNRKQVLEALLIFGLILLIPLFFAMRTRARTNAPAQESTLTEAPIVPTEETTAQKPPACTFPLAQTTTEETTPEEYIFSEPEVVYHHNSDDETNVEIVEWLPDNQRVLVVQNYNFNQQTIELFTPETGERQVYAIRTQTEQPPSWNQELKAVVYPVRHVTKMEGIIPEFTRQVWVSYGDPQSAQMLADNLAQFSVAIKPGGSQTAYFSSEQIIKQNGLMQSAATVSLDLERWNYRNLKSGIFPLMYNMAWRPKASQVFLYSFADVEPGYTFLLDVNTGEICELDLGGWAVTARWSPNGRYLAIDRSQATHTPFAPTVLTVLDTVTGDIYTSEVIPQELVGIHAVRDIAWAPDNRHLLVIGTIAPFPQCGPDCLEDNRLYLVDFLSGKVDAILTGRQFNSGNPGTSLAWSPDGSKVIALCPALCRISVQVNGK